MYLQEELYKNQDLKYREFNSSLIPNVDKEYVIGVRVPVLRKIAKELWKEDCKSFLHSLPHTYFEENMIHSYLITMIKDYDTCINELNRFIPYIDNWAVSDALSCKNLKKYRAQLIEQIPQWIENDHPYSKRVAILLLMNHYLDEDFNEKYFDYIIPIRSEDYYVNMIIAWYFATALAKQWDSTIQILEENKLDQWIHNKTIQKAIESYRITDEQKIYLRTLKRPK